MKWLTDLFKRRQSPHRIERQAVANTCGDACNSCNTMLKLHW